jgi:hypothetical protein
MPEHIIGEQYLSSKMKKILILIVFFLGLLFLLYSNTFAIEESGVFRLNISPKESLILTNKDVVINVDSFAEWPYTANEISFDMGDGHKKILSCPGGHNCSGSISYKYSTAGDYTIAAVLCYMDGTGAGTPICNEGALTNPSDPDASLCCVTEQTQIQVGSLCNNNGVIEKDRGEECEAVLPFASCTDLGFKSGDTKCVDCKIDKSGCIAGALKYPNPLKWENVLEFGEYLIIYIFRLASGLAVLMILIGAFIIVTSRGDPSRAAKGKTVVIWAMIGFAVTMLVNGIIALLRALLGVK